MYPLESKIDPYVSQLICVKAESNKYVCVAANFDIYS